MRTLPTRVEHFLQPPAEMQCPEMRIHGWEDHAPPVFTGVGSLHFEDPYSIRFVMNAQARDPGDAMRRLSRSQHAPYDVRTAFRLLVKDYADVEWNCGWMRPRISDASGPHLLLTGTVENLLAVVEGPFVAEDSGVELVFAPAPDLPLSEPLVTTAHIGDEEISRRVSVSGRHVSEVLGSRIEVSQDPWSEQLWLTASTSDQLAHPYFENWLSEPLRVLCGQLIYPRLAARNFGDGRAFISVRRCLPLVSTVGGVASVVGDEPGTFWGFYERYLSYLAGCRGPKGQPNLQSNPLTRFHEEVIQAAGGSRWMLALATASAVEGVCKIAAGDAGLPSEHRPADIAAVRKRLKSWKKFTGIRDRLLPPLDYIGQPSVRAFLGRLVTTSAISKRHRDAWTHVRNRVAHGVLGDPWSDEESDQRLGLLLELLDTLTVRIVRGEAP